MVLLPVVEGVQTTLQEEVLVPGGSATNPHVGAERDGVDAVKFAVPRGEPFGCPAVVFVTVAVHVVELGGFMRCTELGLHDTETLVWAWGRGVGVLVGVGLGGGGVRAGVSVGFGVGVATKVVGITAVTQFSPESPPDLFWSPSCTMNSNRYAWPACNGAPFLSCKVERLKRISAA